MQILNDQARWFRLTEQYWKYSNHGLSGDRPGPILAQTILPRGAGEVTLAVGDNGEGPGRAKATLTVYVSRRLCLATIMRP